MKTLLSIDPGNNAGGAVFVDNCLKACGLVSRGWGEAGHLLPLLELQQRFPGAVVCRFDELVIELPRITRGPGGQTEGKDPNDLIKLAFGAGRYVERFPHTSLRTVYPSEWKAGVPKRTHNARVILALSEAERALIPKLAASLVHNVVDAIGIGLEHLGRMTRGAAR
jgi:hypothetical protein